MALPVAIIAALFAIIYAMVLVYTRHENTKQKILEQELTNLSVPQGCTETSRYYRKGDVVLNSSWEVKYKCQSTGKQAYDSVIENLNKRGYREDIDYSKQGSDDRPCCIYSFAYASDSFHVHYYFDPQHGFAEKPLDQIQNSPVNTVKLVLQTR